jgi:hypothetical protein
VCFLVSGDADDQVHFGECFLCLFELSHVSAS